MKADFKQRLIQIETATEDWAARLDTVDYDWTLDDYSEKRWKEIYRGGSITVLQNRASGEIRGVFWDRRTEAEMLEQGVDLAYL